MKQPLAVMMLLPLILSLLLCAFLGKLLSLVCNLLNLACNLLILACNSLRTKEAELQAQSIKFIRLAGHKVKGRVIKASQRIKRGSIILYQKRIFQSHCQDILNHKLKGRSHSSVKTLHWVKLAFCDIMQHSLSCHKRLTRQYWKRGCTLSNISRCTCTRTALLTRQWRILVLESIMYTSQNKSCPLTPGFTPPISKQKQWHCQLVCNLAV